MTSSSLNAITNAPMTSAIRNAPAVTLTVGSHEFGSRRSALGSGSSGSGAAPGGGAGACVLMR